RVRALRPERPGAAAPGPAGDADRRRPHAQSPDDRAVADGEHEGHRGEVARRQDLLRRRGSGGVPRGCRAAARRGAAHQVRRRLRGREGAVREVRRPFRSQAARRDRRARRQAASAVVHRLRHAEARAGQKRRCDHRREDLLPAGPDGADARVLGGHPEPPALVFSSRVPADLAVNGLSRAVADAYADGRPLIDLTLSNPTRAGFEYPDYLLSALADERGLKYEPSPFGLVSARQAVARDYARRGLTVSSDRIALTASTSEAYSLLFKLLADAGDDVLVPVPSYPLFDHLAQLDGVVLRRYELEYQNGWSIDVGSIERALSPSTRALLLVTPNNPTGSFVSRAELKQLQAICAQRNIALVADEVFADYQVRPGACVDAARVLDATDGLVFSLGGLSKTVGLP